MSNKNTPKAVKLPKEAGKVTTGSKALKPKAEPGVDAEGEGKPLPFSNQDASPMKLAKPNAADPAQGPYKSPGIDEEANGSKPAKKGKGGLQYGNQDKEKKVDLSGLNVPDDHVVVRHYGNVTLSNGQQVEDPTTSRIQVYDKNTFKSLSEQRIVNGKQEASQFDQMGMNVQVLHK